MQLISSDKETVTIQMDWQEEFAPILAAFTAVNRDYEIVDYLLHELSKEEVAAIQSNLANIKADFFNRGISSVANNKQAELQMVRADQKTVTVMMSQLKVFLGISGILRALDIRYELTNQEVDAKISNLSRSQLLQIEDAWWVILKQLNMQYNDQAL